VDQIEAGRMITLYYDRLLWSEAAEVIMLGYQPTLPNPFAQGAETMEGKERIHYCPLPQR
jgi:hypothetical protein